MKRSTSGSANNPKRRVFQPYWPEDLVAQSMERGQLLRGKLRINQRNFEQAYIPHESEDMDVLIQGVPDRNRALHGDEVAVKVKHYDCWRIVEENLYLYPELLEKLSGVEDANRGGFSGDGFAQASKGPQMKENQPPASQSNKESVCKAASSGSKYKRNAAMSGLFSLPGDVTTKIEELNISRNCKTTPDELPPPPAAAVAAKPKQPPRQSIVNSFKTPADYLSDIVFPEDCIQKTGEVVFVFERNNTAIGVGQLRLQANGNTSFALFSPQDPKCPRMLIPMKECPANFLQRPEDYSKLLFAARIRDWPETSAMAHGTLTTCLGSAGEIEPETAGILAATGIDDSEFSPEVLACLPEVSPDNPWRITPDELARRRDLREECIFTVDPLTARDLDDALHIKPWDGEENMFEVGVHIADVAHFIRPGTALDAVARDRATSTYLVQKVVPMLPRLLCEELCSLQPGVERLAFSVIWKIDSEGQVYSEWFGRSVIRSCSQLNYDVAQSFIAEPERDFLRQELPALWDADGKFTTRMLVEKVNLMNNLAKKLRSRRFTEGALRLDKPKMSFTLDAEMTKPIACSTYKLKDSNRMIEEFMLMANMAVARRIYNSYKQTSILRRHNPPKPKVLKEVMQTCALLGYPLSVDGSSGSLHGALREYERRARFEPRVRAALPVLTEYVSKPMVLAEYFCTGVVKDETKFCHYALNVPLYTHFTSPIRRYPDILVHRLLAASVDDSEPAPESSIEDLRNAAKQCNERKIGAKMAGDQSAELFFGLFVRECGPINATAVVTGVLDRRLDVMLLEWGITRYIYLEKVPGLASFDYTKGPPPQVVLRWSDGETQEVNICDALSVVLEKFANDALKVNTTLLQTRPTLETEEEESGDRPAPIMRQRESEV